MGETTQAMPDGKPQTESAKDGVDKADAGGRKGGGESGGGAYKDPDQAQGDGLHDDPKGAGREGRDETDQRSR